MIRWNTERMFELADGPRGLLALCTRTASGANPPSMTTINVWKHRRRISAEWLPVVVSGLLDLGCAPNELFRR